MSEAMRKAEGWRAPILHYFTPEIAATACLTIVADPDRLLAEQTVLEAIRERGFDLIPFDDPIAFRYAYESRYRRRWDRGERTPLIVVLRSGRGDVETLPFDLLKTARRSGRILHFGLAEIFPRLSPGVVAQLDRSYFDTLYEAVRVANPGDLGERATKDFVLLHVFEIAPELIKTPVDLIQMLLRRHYRNRQLPTALDERLIERLREHGRFTDWPLERIVPDRQAFFAFLEERWPVFLRSRIVKGKVREAIPVYPLAFSGPEDLPFDHEDIRVYIDNLFVEGYLAPTDVIPTETVRGTWLAWGVRDANGNNARLRFRELTAVLRSALPGEDAVYHEWIEFARRWAEWLAVRAELGSEAEVEGEAERLWSDVDDRFAAWMQKHFTSLHNLAYLPQPAIVHHIAPYLAHGWTSTSHHPRKVALVVVDGLAWSQWVPLRASIKEHGSKSITIQEHGIFAWVPTITPVSRQAIFAGEAPLYFGQSIDVTSKDEQHWRRFWEDRGARGNEIQFVAPRAKEPEASFFERVMAAADHPGCIVLGAVVPILDEMMHGTATGSGGLYAQVSHWAGEGYFLRLVEALVERGFAVYLTSDHGNVECTGVGKPNVGALAGERGERVHVFNDELVRQKTHEQYPASILWPSAGLPDGYYPLVATGRAAFISEGKRAVSHGGISLEEVVVPFITIEE